MGESRDVPTSYSLTQIYSNINDYVSWLRTLPSGQIASQSEKDIGKEGHKAVCPIFDYPKE